MSRPDPKFLKRLKELVGENSTEFARRIGISQPLVHGYLSGRYAPGFDFFLALAKHGIDINWLLTGQTKSGPISMQAFSKAQQMTLLLSKLPANQADVVEKTMETLVEGLAATKRKSQRPR